MAEIDKIIYELLCVQLQSIGLFEDGRFSFSKISKINKTYIKWLEETRLVLTRSGYLKDPFLLDQKTVWREWDNKNKDSNLGPMIELLETTLKALPEILLGKVKATDIIFPNSSMALVERIYKNNETADYFNEVLVNALIIYIQEKLKREPNAKVKIFEIGAGTGGTSAMVFKKLKDYRDHVGEYCYTDISKAFLLHAEQKYSFENPYLTFKTFNVEMPIAEQGVEPGGYDVVIAANVLHATKNICNTLRNTKSLLKNRGLLFLNEINSNNLFSHLTFGLLEGWWLYEDPELRIPGCPALSSEAWQKSLENEGFEKVLFLPSKPKKEGQQIIVAESNGVVRQKRSPSKEVIPPVRSTAGDVLIESALSLVKTILAKTIKLAPEKIEINTPFEKYGVDSILQVNFIKELEKAVGEIPKTILFEYPTPDELAKYLEQNHSNRLGQKAKDVNEYRQLPNPIRVGSEKIFSKQKAPTNIPKQTEKLGIRQGGATDFLFKARGSANRHGPSLKRKSCSIADAAENQLFSLFGYTEDIAIIGMSGRYPLSNNLSELWDNLKAGRNCITEAPASRNAIALKKMVKESSKKRYGGFLEGINRFDYQLFEINPQQVLELSPEVRLFLEVVWETFEDGGYSKNALNQFQQSDQVGIGVFIGNMYNQYFWNLPSWDQALLSSNGTDWNIANRISHFFNLTGPSLAINTACSSSLYAIHLACESLKQKSCSMAIAGGVNLTLNLSKYDLLERAKFLGSGNKSKSFGVGDGLIPGEGVGAVLLKSLSRAIEDKDPIHAVIKGSFVNHSGGRQTYTAPDPRQQAQVIIHSLKKAGVDPATIGYIESAANGSELGDSIEVIALHKAFSQVAKKGTCALGSIKSNLGHLEAASGISQLHKVVLQLKHATLVPTLHAKPTNPNIKLEKTPFHLQEVVQPWEQLKKEAGEMLPRRSLINSFGAGGSYANLIVEEFRTAAAHRSHPSAQDLLFVFSAKTQWSLFAYLEKIKKIIIENPSLNIYDLACSLQRMNHNLESRVAIIASTLKEILQKFDIFLKSNASSLELKIYASLGMKNNSVNESEIAHLLEQKSLKELADLWTSGTAIDFRKLYENVPFSQVELPKYVFDHQVDFIPCAVQNDESEMYEYDDPYLKGHVMNGKQVLVGAIYPSLAVDTFMQLHPGEKVVHIQKLNYNIPIEVGSNQRVELKTIPIQREKAIDFQILFRYSLTEAWKIAASGQMKNGNFPDQQIDLQQLKNSLNEFADLDLIYLDKTGVIWGDIFKRVTQIYMGESALLARIDLKEAEHEWHNYCLNPIITNCCYLSILYLLGQINKTDSFIPFGINEIYFKNNACPRICWLSLRLVKESEEILLFDIDVFTDNSELILAYKGYSLKRVKNETRPSNRAVYLGDDALNLIRKYLCDKFGISAESINLEVKFLELGLDSSELVRITKEIENDLNIELDFTLFFEYSNIRELAQFFFQEHKERFISLATS